MPETTRSLENLFESFSAASEDEWLNQVGKDLKTDSPLKILKRQIDDLEINAAFHDLRKNASHSLDNREPLNPEFAYAADWLSQAASGTDDLVRTNRDLLKMLEHGAGSVLITGFGMSNQEELRLCLKGILPEIAPVSFSAGEAAPATLFMFMDEIQKLRIDSEKVLGSLGWDPLGDFIRYGSFSTDKSEIFRMGKSMLDASQAIIPNYQLIKINGAAIHNSGASAKQELAVICSMIADYVLCFEGVSPEITMRNIRINMSSGSEVFIQIAKFRAMRILWDMLRKGFKVDRELSLHLETETSLRNKTVLDPYNNLLRCTLETFSAVAGGTNEHLVHGYNAHFVAEDREAALLGLNIQHLLREEGRLDKVLDPTSGAPYIEELTNRLVSDAWELFLKWEENGGFVASAQSSEIQNEIIARRVETDREIRTRKRVITGVNRYADAKPVELKKPLAEKDPLLGLPEIKPLEPYFEAAPFESVRKLLCLDKQPIACIFESGDAKMSQLRADFSRDFLACGGIDCVTTDASVGLADCFFSENALSADIWVLCSNDDHYSEMVEILANQPVTAKPIIIAGNPALIGEIPDKENKIFIYQGCDAIQVLHRILEVDQINLEK